MGLKFSFKDSREGYVSRIHPGIRWTCVIISRGRKSTTADVSSASLSLAGDRERVLGNYVFAGAREKGKEADLLNLASGCLCRFVFYFLLACLYRLTGF